MTAPTADPVCYVYWTSNRARRGEPSLRWSLPFADLGEARHWAKAHVEGGKATLATVWAFPEGAPPRLMATYPRSAERVIGHYLEMVGAVRGGPPE